MSQPKLLADVCTSFINSKNTPHVTALGCGCACGGAGTIPVAGNHGFALMPDFVTGRIWKWTRE
jgi:hypothetical protein